MAGIPLPDAMVEQLRAGARIEPVLVDGDGLPTTIGTRTGGHHGLLVPTGRWALVGNPNQPDGLHLVPVDQLTAEHAEQLGLPPPRAAPAFV